VSETGPAQGRKACSVIRHSTTQNAGAVAAVRALTADNLFQGQTPAFFRTLMGLARLPTPRTAHACKRGSRPRRVPGARRGRRVA